LQQSAVQAFERARERERERERERDLIYILISITGDAIPNVYYRSNTHSVTKCNHIAFLLKTLKHPGEKGFGQFSGCQDDELCNCSNV